MRVASLRMPVRAGWLRSPAFDVTMALVWVPFALAAHAVAHDPGQLRGLVTATLLFSFAHQPLSLWLVYGDDRQRDAYRVLFTWAPVVVIAVVAAGTAVQPAVVALVAGAWNLAHTLRQRYGVSRLYGRLSAVDCASDNRLLWAWLAAAVLFALAHANLAAIARQIGLDERSTSAIDALASARGAALTLIPIAGVVAIALTARSARDEVLRTTHSPARLLYLASTALLLVILAVEPVTGFVAYVGGHAAEYFFVVQWRVDRAATKTSVGDRVGALARRVGGVGTLVLYAALIVPLTFWVKAHQESDVGIMVVLTLGALHLLYDGFIWRTPAPARSS
ncbi:MAG: hypothetical protein JO248_14525 [Acidimicrobiia bacterium]|nr:hypothetical protein [Acidimicrobiia bacterium]